MRPIDADEAKKALMGWDNEPLDEDIEITIDNLPTLDLEPVRPNGRWETDSEDILWGNSLKKKHCTNCGARPHFDKESRRFILSKYCPNCGAKMDLEVN